MTVRTSDSLVLADIGKTITIEDDLKPGQTIRGRIVSISHSNSAWKHPESGSTRLEVAVLGEHVTQLFACGTVVNLT